MSKTILSCSTSVGSISINYSIYDFRRIILHRLCDSPASMEDTYHYICFSFYTYAKKFSGIPSKTTSLGLHLIHFQFNIITDSRSTCSMQDLPKLKARLRRNFIKEISLKKCHKVFKWAIMGWQNSSVCVYRRQV